MAKYEQQIKELKQENAAMNKKLTQAAQSSRNSRNTYTQTLQELMAAKRELVNSTSRISELNELNGQMGQSFERMKQEKDLAGSPDNERVARTIIHACGSTRGAPTATKALGAGCRSYYKN